MKLLTCVTLPTSEEEFFTVLSTWFPTVYDVKYMMRACKALKGGLQEVADDLGVSDHVWAFMSFVKLLRHVGHANRSFAPSRFRFTTNCGYLFQNA